MIVNLGKPCEKCKVGFYLEIDIKSPKEVACYNCKHSLPYYIEEE